MNELGDYAAEIYLQAGIEYWRFSIIGADLHDLMSDDVQDLTAMNTGHQG